MAPRRKTPKRAPRPLETNAPPIGKYGAKYGAHPYPVWAHFAMVASHNVMIGRRRLVLPPVARREVAR
jgi:hypothetical protein